MGVAKYMEDNIELIMERRRFSDPEGYGREYEMSSSFESIFPFYVLADVQTSKPAETSPGGNAKKTDEYSDRFLTCRCCGRRFLFSANAQKEYQRHNWNEPKRCKACSKFKAA